jgi:xanthine dehydrogenase YagS FAD-binding subunit
MKNFQYFRPTSAEAAVALLEPAWGKAELLGGGTDLHDLQKEYVAQPEKVISLSGLGGRYNNIAVAKREPPILQIGAGVKLAQLADDAGVKQYCPALATAARMAGTPQLRNMGTLGGNLCQRNRCWYFRDEHVPCLLKGGEKCYALYGENRYHAIFTRGHRCVIVHPSTLAPALIALGAKASVLGPKGDREINLAEFFRAPDGPKDREHVLASNEMVISVTVDVKPNQKSASYEVRHKQSHDWPLVQAAVAFQLEGGKASNVRIVLGHVGPTPVLAEESAKTIEGNEVTEETASAAGEKAAEGARPLAQNAYKVKLASVAVKRALLEAVGKKYW